jgi:DNA-binding CsgD family transcriptional regulator
VLLAFNILNILEGKCQDSLKFLNNIKFTPRQIDILSCLLNGKSTKSIASQIQTSPTVFFYSSHIKTNDQSPLEIFLFQKHLKKALRINKELLEEAILLLRNF